MNEGWNRKVDLAAGVIVLVVVGAAALWFGVIRPILRMPSAPPAMYVAYFENSSGLREGDAVRIQGRRAGRVTQVGVASHDGRTMTRVEFVIDPGSSSQWLKGAAVPRDSTISVKTTGLMSRPQLVISIGNDTDNPIPEGGEWTHARGANQQDQLTQWHEDLLRTQGQIADVMEFFGDEKKFDRLKDQLGDISAALKNADSNLASVTDHADEVNGALDDARKGMDDARDNLKAQADGTAEGLNKLADDSGKADEKLGEVADKLDDALSEVKRLKDGSDDMVSAAGEAKLDKLGLQLRKLAARLRSSMERASGDPAKFGGMPNWRRTRPYFNGGKPSAGTSIDKNPPPAPGEKAGVPQGEDGKRVR